MEFDLISGKACFLGDGVRYSALAVLLCERALPCENRVFTSGFKFHGAMDLDKSDSMWRLMGKGHLIFISEFSGSYKIFNRFKQMRSSRNLIHCATIKENYYARIGSDKLVQQTNNRNSFSSL